MDSTLDFTPNAVVSGAYNYRLDPIGSSIKSVGENACEGPPAALFATTQGIISCFYVSHLRFFGV